ncbi:MAG TPA: type III-B CRISPR module RAMP protein Cmr1, partial [Fimbriimonadales bacterium]|nr:type III-B CRISPR module RAMP protein Cmr1 [Fimbriimonadales bacterium]
MRRGFELPESFKNLEFEEPEIIAKVSLELATPMIGGGAVAGAPDEHWPIRPTEIRGHLRFWWR